MLKNIFERFLSKTNGENADHRIIAGYTVAVIGTALICGLFRHILSIYNPGMLAIAAMLCLGYSMYLYSYEQDRMRLLLAQYFRAIFVLVGIGLIPDILLDELCSYIGVSLHEFLRFMPVIASFGAIAYTTVAWSDPDVVMVEKKKE